jgi:serine/threonine protein kinase
VSTDTDDDDDLDWLLRKVGRAPPRPLDARFIDERYELRERIGEGGFGAVYEAFDHTRGERVALKILHRAAGDALLRFKREFRQLARLSDPSFVRLHDLHGEGERWYFTMERIDGVPFDAWARDPDRLRGAFADLTRALTRLHEHGYVHRDIKPSNVLVEPGGRVVLLDFGLVHALAEASSTAIAGTPSYVAPEVASGGTPSPASDWYACGVMLYEALTGEPPFGGPAEAIVSAKQRSRPPAVRDRAPRAAPDLAALCDALLDPNPDARPVPSGIAVRSETRVTLIGRQRELAELERALADRSSVVRVVGPSGVGKSTLVDLFCPLKKQAPGRVLFSQLHTS